MKRVALYARVSTVGHGQDPELQLRELRAHCQRQGWDIVREYIDLVSSAKERPELNELLADAAQEQFDVVLVWKFDRVARSAIELCQTLEHLQRLDVTFTSLTEQIDTATAAGKLVFTVLGAVAEMERALIRERVKAGLRNADAQGRHGGRRRRIHLTREDALVAMSRYRTLKRAAYALGISYGTLHKLVGARRGR